MAMKTRPSPRRAEKRWSWRIGRIRGIEIRVHATFLVLLVWFGMAAWQESGIWPAVVAEVLFILALFACVALHELGHALTAQRFGIRTRDITLLPIGGVARLERMPAASRQELLIALAGPAVNLVIAAVLLVALVLAAPASLDAAAFVSQSGLDAPTIGVRLATANLALAMFNLLPAFPMDGGRVLRAALAVRMGRLRATQRAAAIGRGFAVVFVLLGLWLSPVLLFVGAFVWIAAAGELMEVELRAAAEHLLVADAMVLRFSAMRDDDSLQQALDELLAGEQQDFPVVASRGVMAAYGRVQGMVYEPELIQGLSEHGQTAPISAVMCEAPVLDAGMPLADALDRFEENGGRTLPVARQGRLVGLLTRQNLGELFAAREALGHELHRQWSATGGIPARA
jgi:Zn-dependent protease